jgi:hypothetical protein
MLALVEQVFNNIILILKYVHAKYSYGVVVMEIKIVFIVEMNVNECVLFIDED